MSKKKPPQTSVDAYNSLEPDKIAAMYIKIQQCLLDHGPQTFEQIADNLGEKPERVWKRLNECMRLGLCYRNGDKRPLKSKRLGFVWHPGKGKDVTKQRATLEGPTVADFSKAILNQPLPSKGIQNTLFPDANSGN